MWYGATRGRLAQLARAPLLHGGSRGFESLIAHSLTRCHRGSYEGDSRIPRLAEQHLAYLEKTMLDFKSKARANSAAKSSLMETYSAEDIERMAEFLAGM